MNLDNSSNTFGFQDEQETVVITGWNYGFKKVEFTKMLKEELGYSLSIAKSVTDKVVDKRRVELIVSKANHERITRLSAALGAIVFGHVQSREAKEQSCQ